jgi:rubrerythrin
VERTVSRRKEHESRARYNDRVTQKKRKRVSQDLRELEGDHLDEVLDLLEHESDEEVFETFEPHLRRVRYT